MKRTLIKIFVAVVAIISTETSAQSLKDLINIALSNNYQIKILKNEAQVASNNNTIGAAGFLPSVDLAGTYFNSYNNTIQKFSDGSTREGNNAKNTGTNFSVLANWTVFNGFKVFAKKEQLTYLEELGQLNSKFYIEQTVSDIVSAYYQLVYEKLILENYKQSLSISLFRLNLENKKNKIGSGKLIDYGQALVDYQSDSIRLLAQQNFIQSLSIEINRVLNTDLEKELIVDSLVFNSLPLSAKDTLLHRIAQNNSQLEQQRLQELIAETDLRMEKANRYPKINLFAGYQYAKTSAEVGFFKSNQNIGPTAGISVSLNLYNGGATNRGIKNKMIYSENNTLSKQQVSQNLNADVLKMFNQYQSINERITLAKSNIEVIKKVYNAAEEQLQRGAINGYDFRLTQLTLLNAEFALIELQFSLKTIEISLSRLSGNVIADYM